VSAAEGAKFAREVAGVKEVVRRVTDEEIRRGVEAFDPGRKSLHEEH
jgi:hypothetical protein